MASSIPIEYKSFLNLTHNLGPNVYYLFKSMDLGVMTMKGYSTLCRSSELEFHNPMQFNVIPRPPPFFKKIFFFICGKRFLTGNTVSIF